MEYKYIDFHCHKKIPTPDKENILPIYSLDACSRYGMVEIDKDDYFTIGIHPWNFTHDLSNEMLEIIFEGLRANAENKNCLFIGETGLDFKSKKNTSQVEKQYLWLVRHLELSKELNKGVVFHAVKAHNEILKCLKQVHFKNSVFFHNFNGNRFEINQLLKFNSYFSLGQNLFQKNSKIVDNIKYIPLEKILLESDDGYYSILEIYQRASALLNLQELKLKKQINDNFKNCQLF